MLSFFRKREGGGQKELREGWQISDYWHLMVWIWSECGTCWPSCRTWDFAEVSLVSTWTINWFHSSSTSWRSSYTSRTKNSRIYIRVEFTNKKCKMAILLYCFHTASALHIFALYNLEHHLIENLKLLLKENQIMK